MYTHTASRELVGKSRFTIIHVAAAKTQARTIVCVPDDIRIACAKCNDMQRHFAAYE